MMSRKVQSPTLAHVSVVLEPNPKRSALLPGVAQQNRSAQVLSTLSPYQWQLGS